MLSELTQTEKDLVIVALKNARSWLKEGAAIDHVAATLFLNPHSLKTWLGRRHLNKNHG